MPPLKRTTNLGERPIIVGEAGRAISEYFQSKLLDSRTKKYPEWDVARICPAAELAKSRRESCLAEMELETKRLEEETKRSMIDQQWTELGHKQELLRQSFVKFNKFVKENSEKRERANHKIGEEKERQAKCNQQIEELTKQLEYTKRVRNDMQKHVKEYKMYQNYLETVVNESEEFQSLADIFNRYESLVESRIDLAQHQDQSLEALEITGAEMVQYYQTKHMTETKGQMLVDLNNKLSTLEGRYERAKAEALRWETIVSRIKATATAKNLELTRIKSSCWNMYLQLCKRKGYSVEVDREDVENQLAHIKRTILELKRITKEATRKTAQGERQADKS